MEELSRRRFIAYMGSAIAVSRNIGLAQAQNEPEKTPGKVAIKYGLLHNEMRCIGCKACIKACKETNSVPDGVTRLDILQTVDIPAVEKTRAIKQFFRKSCQHCENPPCVAVCPTGASFKDALTGIVDVNDKRCVGCRYCIAACPYHVRFINPVTKTADKCNFCRETNLAAGKQPACVEICPTKALVFGDLNDPESNIAKMIASNATYRSKVYLGTEPQLYRMPGKRGEIDNA
ncbi:4Fe-4S dicluster domain-containing protein [Pectobacterium versatile]|uniref:4Fe-4S dicluster domain-containing protein n=1 Tax=Pectobacterium versatile TaxID=2488639 RepID=A0AAW3RPU8_9GAMM|nr:MULTISPECIES: 4Fe-4S dicluster domain-containing protein [Pectobacterium]AZK61672.1 4Fe-4S dicluster domain-containing protein [Pectobacterium versatile]MBA0157906.1 4Fe-4S dicluster domain-containing protein [Pectobacterium versatile]MBA0170326.1 4Fe-4S dicluster domain-containing protein [Pectobacterium versatile]MBN3058449.1 4Fe-4S dicluster domain-containing protein [Pectobacterium versatile]MBN3237272.1 4Fe-4S dicluster domain-containing protein [Pectobacterium versatile]